ncbi:MAG: DsbA family protein [Acidimicrobiales bacterium]
MVNSTAEARLVIVFDALCGWSYAAWPTLEAIWESHRDRVAFDVVSGGLFVGDRVQPIGNITYIPTANRRISELSGAVFGEGYEAMRSEGSYLLDSTGPAWRFAVLRSLAADQAVPLAHDLQRRHYVEGADLDQPGVYEAVATHAGLSVAALRVAMANADPEALTTAEFSYARALGVEAYPTVLLLQDDHARVLSQGLPDHDQLDNALTTALATGATT